MFPSDRYLLETQAHRDLLQGHAFPADTPWQHEFDASFPFRETVDQLRVIDDYSAEIPCSDSSMDAAVTAFNEAIAGVFAEFLADIRDSEPTERIPMSCGRC